MPRLPGIGGGGSVSRRRAVAVCGLILAFPITLCLHPHPARAADPVPVNYAHKTVKRSEFGTGARSYWIFEPADPSPTKASVVVLNHGWLAVNPSAYGAWITHLVKSGHIVVYPRYQADALTLPTEFLSNAVAAVLDALVVLDGAPGHVRPDRKRFALVGHSAGGNLAVQMAALAASSGLPKPCAVVAMMPGEVQPMREPDLSKIPGETLLIVAVAENDRIVGDNRAREIFTDATSIPLSRKKFVFYRTDLHGIPWLVAHHFAPTAHDGTFGNGDGMLQGFQKAQAEINALDRAGFWRLTDMTLAAAFAGQTLDAATDSGAHFRHLGYWSDGRPVTPPLVEDDLAKIPRIFPSHGVRLIPWPTAEFFRFASPPTVTATRPEEPIRR